MTDEVTVVPALAPVEPETLGAEELYRRHAGFVAGFLARLGVRAQEAQDMVQEVFLVAHRHGGFRPGVARPTTWLARIAIHVAARRRRWRDEGGGEDALAAVPDGRDGPHETLEKAQLGRQVHCALGALKQDLRAVFVLFELERESCDAIAAGLGIPVGTVYSRLHTARREFQREFERLERRAPIRQAPSKGDGR